MHYSFFFLSMQEVFFKFMVTIRFHEGRRIETVVVASVEGTVLHNAARGALGVAPTDRLRLIWKGKTIIDSGDTVVDDSAGHADILAVIGRESLNAHGEATMVADWRWRSVAAMAYQTLDITHDFLRTVFDTKYDRIAPPTK